MADRTCLWCSISIQHLIPKAKYCSARHKRAAQRAVVRERERAAGLRTRTCVQCGIQFENGQPSAIRCSAECKTKARHMQRARPQRPERHVHCPWCDKEFVTRNLKKKFCTPHCCRTYYNRQMIEQRGGRRPYIPRPPVESDLLGKVCSFWGIYKLYGEYQKRTASMDGIFSRCRDCRRLAWKADKYAITMEEVRQIEATTECQICGKGIDYRMGTLAIDHCHDSGAVRGALCTQCNVGIGALTDSAEMTMRAAEYLLSHVNVLGMIQQSIGSRSI